MSRTDSLFHPKDHQLLRVRKIYMHADYYNYQESILKTTAILCWHLYWCCVIFLNKHSIIGEVLVGLSLFAGIFFCISVFHCWSSIKFPVTLPRRRTKFQKVARFQNWLVFKSINNEASLLTTIFQLVDRLDRLIDWWSPIYFVQSKHLKNLYVQILS